MKIGIVTIYNGNNFGAYLQAYALKKYLEKQGNSVYHIKINKESEASVLLLLPAPLPSGSFR